MENKQDLEARVSRAVDYFMQGYGCCQSVVAAFADMYGLDEKLALKIAGGFGGGVGRMRMICGAVSGLVMLIGLEEGETDGANTEGKSHCYKIVQQLLEESRRQNGSIICRQLLGLDPDFKPQPPEPRTDGYYKKRPCPEMVYCAAKILEEYLEQNPE